MKNLKVLILEDDLETLEAILQVLKNLRDLKGVSFAVTILSDYLQVESYINANPQIKYNILILDRNDSLGASFHNINLNLFNKDNIISISTVPEFNHELTTKGVHKMINKDYQNLSDFSSQLIRYIQYILEG